MELEGSITQLPLTHRAVTIGVQSLEGNNVAELITLSSPGGMVKLSSYKVMLVR